MRLEHDVVLARQRAGRSPRLLGFDAQDQTRIATAVSEIARNAFQYAGGGRVEFVLDGPPAPALVVAGPRPGPGIADVGPHPRPAGTSRRPAWASASWARGG